MYTLYNILTYILISFYHSILLILQYTPCRQINTSLISSFLEKSVNSNELRNYSPLTSIMPDTYISYIEASLSVKNSETDDIFNHLERQAYMTLH